MGKAEKHSAGVGGGGGSNTAGFRVQQEGTAQILLRGNDVFYNKAQIVNRDLSIAVLRSFVEARAEEAEACQGSRKQRAALRALLQDPAQPRAGGGREGHAGEHAGAAEGPQADGSGDRGSAGTLADAPAAPNSGAPKASLRPLRVLEALAASGLRAMRYACEVEGVGEVVALDKDPVAVEACQRNLEHNKSVLASNSGGAEVPHVDASARLRQAQALERVKPEQGDARLYMLANEKAFDAVDLDPYGTPSIFLDSAVQTVADGGLLLCTATDMAVLCGNNAEVCYSKYGSYPHRAKYCHEMALRILLACIESHANRYKRHIVPVLSVSIDFYVRVFVRIYTSAQAVKASPSKLAWVYQCCGCDCFHLQRVGRIVQPRRAKKGAEAESHGNGAADADGAEHADEGTGAAAAQGDAAKQANGSAPSGPVRYLPGLGPTVDRHCSECGKQYAVGGPMWAEPLHDLAWVRQRILPEMERNRAAYPGYAKVHGLLTTVSEELEDVPLFVDVHGMSAVLKCTPPPAVQLRSAIINAGYRVSSTHASPLGLKTDAPMDVLWDIMRCWVQKHKVKDPLPGSPAQAILAKEPKLQANFAKAKGAQSRAQLQGVPRFLPNPEGFWGPKPRARRGACGEADAEGRAEAPAERGEEPGAGLHSNDAVEEKGKDTSGAEEHAQTEGGPLEEDAQEGDGSPKEPAAKRTRT